MRRSSIQRDANFRYDMDAMSMQFVCACCGEKRVSREASSARFTAVRCCACGRGSLLLRSAPALPVVCPNSLHPLPSLPPLPRLL